MNEEDERMHLGDVHFTTELIDVGPDRKRISSFARTASMHVSRDQAAGAPHPALEGGGGGIAEGNAPSGMPAPARRMTVIGTTGAKNTKNVAAVRYCLYRATAGAVWWPVRLLKTVLVNNTTTGPSNEKPTPILLPRKTSHSAIPGMSPSVNAYGARSDSVGFIWCGHRAVFIELAPGVTGVLYNCQECEDNVLIIGWHNVSVCVLFCCSHSTH